MAVEVVAINPSKAGKKTKKGKKKMAGKKKSSKKRKTTKKRRRNPSVKSAARRVGARAKERFLGMNIKGALSNTVPHVAGALAAKWMAKKFPGVDGGSDREDWEWSNYLAGGFGGLLAGFLAENVKRGSGQKVLEGALTLMGYKLFVNEIAYRSEFLTEQFGQDEEEVVYLGEGVDAEEGDLLLGDDGQMYMMGADGYTRPVDERHRMLAAEMARRALAEKAAGGGYGDVLAPPTPTLGDALARSTPTLGGMMDGRRDPYLAMYQPQ